MNKHWDLITIDSYSHWPEVCFTNCADAEFAVTALRKIFSSEDVPRALITGNGSHFAAEKVTSWDKRISCRHLLTAPRNTQSNGLAEKLARTLECVIKSLSPSTIQENERGIDNVLPQYRNTTHGTTRTSPTQLFKSRILQSNLSCLKSTDVAYQSDSDL